MFDESLEVHEDVELCVRLGRAGREVVIAPEVRVGHCRDTTYRSFVRRNFAMGRAGRALGVHRLPHTVLALSLVCAAILGVLSVFFPPLSVMLCLAAGAYCAVLLVSSVWAAVRTRDLRMLLVVPLVLAGLHVARGLGYLTAGLAGRRQAGET